MNQKYSSTEQLIADCPICRKPYLNLLTSSLGKPQDMITCKNCKMAMFAEDLKKKLFTV